MAEVTKRTALRSWPLCLRRDVLRTGAATAMYLDKKEGMKCILLDKPPHLTATPIARSQFVLHTQSRHQQNTLPHPFGFWRGNAPRAPANTPRPPALFSTPRGSHGACTQKCTPQPRSSPWSPSLAAIPPPRWLSTRRRRHCPAFIPLHQSCAPGALSMPTPRPQRCALTEACPPPFTHPARRPHAPSCIMTNASCAAFTHPVLS